MYWPLALMLPGPVATSPPETDHATSAGRPFGSLRFEHLLAQRRGALGLLLDIGGQLAQLLFLFGG